MSSSINRRSFVVSAAALGLPMAAGCSRDSVSDVVSEAVEEVDSETIEDSMVALRGFEIVAWEIGKRVIWLPVPAVRIIGVSLVVSAGVTKLLIHFLDVELKRREASEELFDDEVVQLESDPQVTFKLENGYTEEIALGPTQYE